MLDKNLIEELGRVLGPSKVVLDAREVSHFSRDALSANRAFGAAPLLERKADAVVRPASSDEVAAIHLYTRSGYKEVRRSGPGDSEVIEFEKRIA